MVQQITDPSWQAEARSEETKQFIQDIKRLTRRKFSAEEKIRIVLEGLVLSVVITFRMAFGS